MKRRYASGKGFNRTAKKKHPFNQVKFVTRGGIRL